MEMESRQKEMVGDVENFLLARSRFFPSVGKRWEKWWQKMVKEKLEYLHRHGGCGRCQWQSHPQPLVLFSPLPRPNLVPIIQIFKWDKAARSTRCVQWVRDEERSFVNLREDLLATVTYHRIILIFGCKTPRRLSLVSEKKGAWEFLLGEGDALSVLPVFAYESPNPFHLYSEPRFESSLSVEKRFTPTVSRERFLFRAGVEGEKPPPMWNSSHASIWPSPLLEKGREACDVGVYEVWAALREPIQLPYHPLSPRALRAHTPWACFPIRGKISPILLSSLQSPENKRELIGIVR